MDDRLIYGIDPSLTATGIATLNNAGQVERLETISFPKLKDEERLAAIIDAVCEKISTPILIVIEGLSLGSHTGMSTERAALHHMLRVAFWEAHIPFLIVPPSTLKKFATGSGKAEKNIMIREVFRRWEVEAKDDNQADAAALAYLGAAYANWTPDAFLIQPQRDVIAALRKKAA
jgi:crossover junction endodeoxyribonuclease RuvC